MTQPSDTSERRVHKEIQMDNVSREGGEVGAVRPSAHHGWFTVLEQPAHPGRIVMLYDDGSGGRLYYYAGDGVLYDGEDGCQYEWADRDGMSVWAYLPPGFRLWVETVETDPCTFPDSEASSGQTPGGPQ